jgi:hypothetical protein
MLVIAQIQTIANNINRLLGKVKLTNGDNDAGVTDAGALKVDGSAATQPVSGAVSVSTVKPDGTNTAPSMDAVARPGYVREVVGGRNKTYADASFVSGDSPVTHDVNTGLGRNGTAGVIENYGSGNIQVEVGDDGANWGDSFVVRAGKSLDLQGLNIDSIRLTHVADTSYQIVVW